MGSKKTPKYPELVMTLDQLYDEPPDWPVLSEFTTGIVDYCRAAGFAVSPMEAATRFIPECLQCLYMQWHNGGEFVCDSFTLGMLNGWMNEWRDLIENGNALRRDVIVTNERVAIFVNYLNERRCAA